jgi:hypothetical protein
LLDIKGGDRKALLAAASENLKSFNQRVDADGERDSQDFSEPDLTRDSIQSFSRPFSFSKPEAIAEDANEEEETGRDSPPAIEYTLPRRASIRFPSYPPTESDVPSRNSAVRRQSLSQSTPLTAAELKRGARNSTHLLLADNEGDAEHALYAAAAARAAQESVDAMSSFYHEPPMSEEAPAPDGEAAYEYESGYGGESAGYGQDYGGSGYDQPYEAYEAEG